MASLIALASRAYGINRYLETLSGAKSLPLRSNVSEGGTLAGQLKVSDRMSTPPFNLAIGSVIESGSNCLEHRV